MLYEVIYYSSTLKTAFANGGFRSCSKDLEN